VSLSVFDSTTHLETLLEVLVFFQELREVYDGLSISDLQLHNFVVNGLCAFYGTDGFFQIDIERPEFEGFEQPRLDRNRLSSTKVRQYQLNNELSRNLTNIVVEIDFDVSWRRGGPLHQSNRLIVVPVTGCNV
jgi:hypothetical protein